MARPKKTESGPSPVEQIQSYLRENSGDHYNFEKERKYTVSSGSLLLDIEMGGGIKPGIVRASGVTEGELHGHLREIRRKIIRRHD